MIDIKQLHNVHSGSKVGTTTYNIDTAIQITFLDDQPGKIFFTSKNSMETSKLYCDMLMYCLYYKNIPFTRRHKNIIELNNKEIIFITHKWYENTKYGMLDHYLIEDY